MYLWKGIYKNTILGHTLPYTIMYIHDKKYMIVLILVSNLINSLLIMKKHLHAILSIHKSNFISAIFHKCDISF